MEPRECWFVATRHGDEIVNYIVAAVSERSARMMVRREHPERHITEACPIKFSHAWEVTRYRAEQSSTPATP